MIENLQRRRGAQSGGGKERGLFIRGHVGGRFVPESLGLRRIKVCFCLLRPAPAMKAVSLWGARP